MSNDEYQQKQFWDTDYLLSFSKKQIKRIKKNFFTQGEVPSSRSKKTIKIEQEINNSILKNFRD